MLALSVNAAGTNEVAAKTPVGQTLYTQFSLYYEKNIYPITNYRRGIFVPANTEVKFVKAGENVIVVTLPDGQNLTIKNIKQYSGEEIDSVFKRTFSVKPLDLSSFTENEKKAIMLGEVKLGMSKSAVIAALGYPPKHKTPSLESNQWLYWQNRFNTFIVNFDKNQVTRIQD